MLVKEGDLLKSDADFIAHQCNCVTTQSKGLSSLIFSQFPSADIYATRTKPDKLGTIIVCGNGQDNRYVINMLAQYYPGKPRYGRDSAERRLAAFQQCLSHIAQIPSIAGKSVAFPFGIGCGLAGGDWEKYEKVLSDWSCSVKDTITVFLVKK
jgi:O-acetyl-ADP-ribose deacetylase (regulator of RNase III)